MIYTPFLVHCTISMRLALDVLKVVAHLGVDVDAIDTPQVLDTRCLQHRWQIRLDWFARLHIEECTAMR
jgi:hypothetical protein